MDVTAEMKMDLSDYQKGIAEAKGEAVRLRQELAKKTAGIEEAVLGKTARYREIINRVREDAKALKAELALAHKNVLPHDLINLPKPDFKAFNKHIETEGKKSGAILSQGLKSGMSFGKELFAGATASGIGLLLAGATKVGREGAAFNMSLDNAEVGIANVLRRFDGLNQTAAKNEAAKALERIIQLEPVTAGGLEDLTMGFMKTLATAKGIGLTTMQNVELTAKFANAVANAGLPLDQLTQEYRSILSGNITKDSQIAKILGITNEDIGNAKAAGDVYDYLTQKLGEFGEAGDGAQVAFSSLGSALSKSFGNLTAGAFDTAVQGAKDLAFYLEETSYQSKAAGSAFGDYLYVLMDGFKNLPTAKNLPGVNPWSMIMPAKEDIEMARLLDEQTNRTRKKDALQNRADDPTVTAAEREKIMSQIYAINMQDLEVEKEAARLRQEKGLSDSESLKQARELVGMREESRKVEREESAKVEEERDRANEKAVRDREEQLKHVKVMRSQISGLIQDMLAPDQKLTALQAQLSDIFVGAQLGSGKSMSPNLESLKALAEQQRKSGNVNGEAATLARLQDALKIQKEMESIQASLRDKGVKSAEETADKSKQEAEKVKRLAKEAADKAKQESEKKTQQSTAMADFDREMAIIRAQIGGHKELVTTLEKERDIEEMKRQIMESQGLTADEALRKARERVELERRMKEEVKKETSRYNDDGRRADGRRQIKGYSREQGDSQAQQMGAEAQRQAAYDRAAARRGAKYGGLDEYQRNQQTPLRDTFQFPSLDDQARRNADNASPLADQARRNEQTQNAADRPPAGGSEALGQQVLGFMQQIVGILGS